MSLFFAKWKERKSSLGGKGEVLTPVCSFLVSSQLFTRNQLAGIVDSRKNPCKALKRKRWGCCT